MGRRNSRGGPRSSEGHLQASYAATSVSAVRKNHEPPFNKLFGLQRLDVFRQILNAQLRNRGRSTSTVQGTEQVAPDRHLHISVRGNVGAKGQSGCNCILWIFAAMGLGQDRQVRRRLLEGRRGRAIALAGHPVAGGTVGYIHLPGVAGVGVNDGLRVDGHVL